MDLLGPWWNRDDARYPRRVNLLSAFIQVKVELLVICVCDLIAENFLITLSTSTTYTWRLLIRAILRSYSEKSQHIIQLPYASSLFNCNTLTALENPFSSLFTRQHVDPQQNHHRLRCHRYQPTGIPSNQASQC